MSVLRINAQGVTPVLHGAKRPLQPALEAAIPKSGPIVVMIHGYKFQPEHHLHCPHKHIFALEDLRAGQVISWPARLGMGSNQPDRGLAIAFGWQARGTLWTARESAREAARALATLVRMLRRQAPDRQVHILAHSMGCYVAMKTLHLVAANDIGRVIALNGAVYRGQVERALGTPAGSACEFFSVVSQENAIYQRMFEYVVRPEDRGDRAVGPIRAPNAVTLDLSDKSTLDMLAQLGHPIAARDRRYCHWSTYLRPGVFSLYQALIRRPETTPLAMMQAKVPTETPKLWSLPKFPSMPEHGHQA